MRPNHAFLYIIFFSLFACGPVNTGESEADFEREIRSSIMVLNEFDKNQDSVQFDANKIHEEVNKILLLSKDIENLSASVNRGNAYFSDMAGQYRLAPNRFVSLHTGMHVNAIGQALRQNELFLLNELIFKTGSNAPVLHSAQ